MAYPSDPIEGNLLVVVLVDRGGGTTPSMAGPWAMVEHGGKVDVDEGTMWWRVAPGGPVTATVSGPNNERRMYIMEFDGGAAGVMDASAALGAGPSFTYTIPDVTATGSAVLVGLALGGDGPPNPVTFTDDPDYTEVDQGQVGGALNPESIVSYRVVSAGTYDFAPVSNRNTVYGGVLGAFDLGLAWIGGGYLSVDGDDDTCTRIEGPNVIRIDLGEAFEIGRLRMVIGTETAGARSYLLEGANEADFSDAVSVATIDFTATGSFTSQTVIETWTPTDSYQFWQLTGNDETRDVCTFTLQEPGATDAGEVQAALDDHIADPTDAHDASAVSIADSGGYFTGTDVEAALQELGAGGGGGGTGRMGPPGQDGEPGESGLIIVQSQSAGSSSLTVAETDGSPSASGITQLTFPNDTVSIAGTVATIRDVPSAFIGCRAIKTSSFSHTSSGSFMAITLDGTDVFDTDGFHNPSSNPSRVTIPAGLGGKYLIHGSFEWDTNTAGGERGGR